MNPRVTHCSTLNPASRLRGIFILEHGFALGAILERAFAPSAILEHGFALPKHVLLDTMPEVMCVLSGKGVSMNYGQSLEVTQ